MKVIECDRHKGVRDAERVSFALNRIVMTRSMAYDEIEFPVYGVIQDGAGSSAFSIQESATATACLQIRRA